MNKENEKQSQPIDRGIEKYLEQLFDKYEQLALNSGNESSRMGYAITRNSIQEVLHIIQANPPQPIASAYKDDCAHDALVDTGVGYYFCPACRSSWTNEELKGSRPAYKDDESLYIWDGIVSELEKVKSFKDASKWIVENYCDGDKCHPDIESIELFKKVGNVVLVETDDPDVCELELRVLAGYATQPIDSDDKIQKDKI